MVDISAETFAKRVLSSSLLTTSELEQAFENAGGRENASLLELVHSCEKLEILTNWQMSRIVDGETDGYFYGEWRVLYLVAADKFGRTYRATNSNGDLRAIKVLRRRHSSDIEQRKAFLQEAKTAMETARDSSLHIWWQRGQWLKQPKVQIFDVAETNDQVYVVMEFSEDLDFSSQVWV